jgi:hypothetical protein
MTTGVERRPTSASQLLHSASICNTGMACILDDECQTEAYDEPRSGHMIERFAIRGQSALCAEGSEPRPRGLATVASQLPMMIKLKAGRVVGIGG